MSETPGGLSTAPEQTISCKRCNQQNPPNSKFCGSCGMSFVVMQRKSCLLCNVLLHFKAEKCQVCTAPQDSDMFDQTPLKPCINSQCKALLVFDSATCYQCKSPQIQYQPSPDVAPNIPPATSRDELSSMLDTRTLSESNQEIDKFLGTILTSERVSEQPVIDISDILPVATTPQQDDMSGRTVSPIAVDNQLDIDPMETDSHSCLLIVPQTSSVTSPHHPPSKRQHTSETSEYPGKKRKTENEPDDNFGDTVIVKEDVIHQMSPSKLHDITVNTCGIEGESIDTCLELPLSEESIIDPVSSSLDSNLQSHVVNTSGQRTSETPEYPGKKRKTDDESDDNFGDTIIVKEEDVIHQMSPSKLHDTTVNTCGIEGESTDTCLELPLSEESIIVPVSSSLDSNLQSHVVNTSGQCTSETPEYPGKKRKIEDYSDDNFGDTVIVKEDVIHQMSPSKLHDTTVNTCGIEGESIDTCLELPLSEESIIVPVSSSLDSNLQSHVVNTSGQRTSETPEYPGKKRKTDDESDDNFGDTIIVKEEDVIHQMSPSKLHDTTVNTCGIEGESTDTCLELPLSEESIIVPVSSSQDSILQSHVVNTSGIEENNTKICHTVPSLAPLPDSNTTPGVLLPPELSCKDHQSKNVNSQTHDHLSYFDNTESNDAKEISIEIQGDKSTGQQNVNEAQKRKKSDSTDLEEPAPKKIPKEDEYPSLPEATAPPDLILDPKEIKEELNQETSETKENKTLVSQPYTTSTGDKSTHNNDDLFIGEASDTDITPVSSPIAGNQKQLPIESDGATSKKDKKLMSEVHSTEMSNNDNKSKDGGKTKTTTEVTQQMPKTGPLTSVLNPNKENAMWLQFNAIIPLDAWEWEEGKSSVYMRFGVKELGNWKLDIGPGELVRDAGNGLHVIKFCFEVDYDFVKSKKYPGIPYKYVVFSPKMEDLGHPYEYLYGAPKEHPKNNRLLKIQNEKIHSGSVHKQFDAMIYPESKTNTGIINTLVGYFVGSHSIPSPSEMRIKSMEIHLEPLRNVLLSGKLDEKFEIHTETDECIDVLNCAYMQYIDHHCEGQKPWMLKKEISEAVKEWIETVAIELLTSESLESYQRLVSGILLLCCLHRSVNFLKINILMKMRIDFLQLISLSQEKELQYLQSLMLKPDSKTYVINAMKYILEMVMNTRKVENVLHIIKALPLYHFISADRRPYEPFHTPLKSIKWGDTIVGIMNMKSFMDDKSGFIKDHHDVLQNLLAFDSKLLSLIPYICPQGDLCHLCEIIPLHIGIVCISERMGHSSKLANEKKMQDLFVKPLTVIQQRLDEEKIEDFQDIKLCADAATILIESLKEKLVNTSKNVKTSITSTISLILHIVYKIRRIEDQSKECASLIEDIEIKIKMMLKEWITSKDVIGGSFFGFSVKSIGARRTELIKEEQELKLWETIVSMKFPHQQMHEELEMIISSLVKDRISNIPSPELKIDLFINVESRQEIPDFFRNIFLTMAIEVLDELVSKTEMQSIRRWDQLVENKSQRIVRLVGSILKKKYPHFHETNEIPFDDLLEWELWPGCLKIYASQLDIRNDSQEDWKFIVTCALSQLEDVCSKIQSGNVTIKELEHIESKQSQMRKLCEAFSYTVTSGPQRQATQLQSNIMQRLKEYNHFKEYTAKLEYFLTHLGKIVKGQPKLLGMLQRNFKEEKINNLCQTLSSDSSCHVVYFSTAKPIESCVDNFYVISYTHSSDLFNRFWQERLTEVGRDLRTIKFTQVNEFLWEPVFDQCVSLLDDLHSGLLKLSAVDALFKKRYSSDPEKLHVDLNKLHSAVSICRGKSSSNIRWIKTAVNQMGQYWDLCSYQEAALAFLKIRDTLGLTGDFSLVESVAKNTSASLGYQTLGSIDRSVVEASGFLHDYAADSKKRECLETFADCQEIVEWIRKVATDVSSLLNFVTVALATAAGGEGDMTTDKLSYLRTVGSGFGPLIYKLPRTASYQQLQEHCKTIWETLEHAPTLPEMIRTCQREIDWYQSVKETQGSVEITSFGQMRNIITYGLYEIGTSRKRILTNRSEAIHLRLRQSKTKRIHKLQYTLDEVRDLESKLVLITGRESEERQKVDLFLDIFHSVCRIADVLISLQQSGNDKYIGWSMLFPCSIDNVVQVLKYQASEMEKDLEDWKNELSHNRDQFYELNYFTNSQQLSLREELGYFKSSPISTKPVNLEVMSLLQCLSREITSDLVKEEVQVVSAIVQEQELALTAFDKQTISSRRQEALIPVNLTTQNMSHNIFTPVTEINNETLSDNKISSMTSGVLEHIMETEKVSSGPQPRLNEDDLTDKQKATLANLKESCGFSKKLILLAFERSAKPDIEEAIEAWCNENVENFNFSDSDVDSEAKTDPYSIPSDDEQLQMESEDKNEDVVIILSSEDEADIMAIDGSNVIDLIGHKPSTKLYQKPAMFKLTAKEQIPIDENHPVVKELMETGFSLEECKTAAERYPDNTQKAMEYIMEDSEKLSELFPRSISHDFIVEDRGMALEEERYDRQQSGVSEGSPVNVNDMEIVCSDTSASNYLSILELGMVLQRLSNICRASVDQNRPFSDILKIGEPNLLVATPDTVLKTVLSLYMEDDKLPLPTHEEVLICSEHTTDEEVTLLWKRAMGDPNHFRIFCLVHAELLSYQVCDKALKTLFECSQGQRNYKLVIICSNEEEDKSHMISKLQFYRRPFTTLHSVQTFSQYLITHFISWPQSGLKGQRILASVVDPENSYVRVVKSERAGMGKSLYIQRLKEELQAKTRKGPHHVIIPVHGPKVTFDTIVQALKCPFEKMTDPDSRQAIIFHIDISPSVLRQVDSVLFSLLILQAVCDSQGRIWRCHPAHLYTIEVTVPKSEVEVSKCTISLLDILPTMECLSPRNVLQMLQNELNDSLKCSMDSGEFSSTVFQRVYQYLRRHVECVSLDRFSYRPQYVEGNPVECLQILLSQCGVRDPSWSELRHFVRFLDTQLRNCENSSFCNEDIVEDVMSGLKTFVVKFMIRMSKDFATSSLKGEVAAENEEVLDEEQLQEYQIDERKQWEQNYHPYLFFNEDGMSITFVGFNATRNGDLQDPVKNVVIEAAALTPQLYTGLQHNQVNLSENYQAWDKDIMIQKIGMVMGLEWSLDPDETYVLTVDNVIKIMAIHMRFRCNIPVVIMGETGCGKTRLIRFMCDLAAQGCRQGGEHVKNMVIMKIHGGTTENDIVKKVEEAEEIAQRNRKDHEVDTVLFFDEANTTEAIGLIKEVMCDRRIHGRSIKADVKFIAACNPYRKHTDDMIKKLESAGLGFYVKATETQHKLGTIPLRQLVYRVLDLPPSMRPLVYDFGQLNNETEKDYTKQIVWNRCQAIPEISGQVEIINTVADVLAWSQKYMKKRNDECSFVSLRDVERVMIVFRYFCEKSDLFTQEVKIEAQDEEKETVDEISRALILAVSVCYHARLQDRKKYERGVVKQFKAPLGVPGGAEQFCNEIRWCQDVLLDNMKLGPNIAKNAALRENVFMMAICIELRIPLFLVGKPGSSKSLAKSIVADSMLGKASEQNVMKEFKEVHMFPYQCSQLSTPESVIEIFNSAKSFQKKQDTTKYVSVVVLDEVGLAEDSPNLPLKALHPLLEDGTEGADNSQQIIEREQRVAFIGISNWALDPAKMNRGVMVTRGDPDRNELELSARGICSNRPDDPVTGRLNPYFQSLAAAYKAISDKQSKPFFGLRDFYSLIKMLYWMCQKSQNPPTGPQLQHAIKRNFGGLNDFDTYDIFKRYLKNIEDQPDLTGLSKEDCELLSPDCSPLGLIRKSLQTKETSWHGENRYLLFLTENYAALQVLKHYLQEELGITVNQERPGGLEESTHNVQTMKPFVLFGSSFPKDREYTQVCRNINQIKICMETGRTVILLNLENLYESLYDLLNQYYIHLGGGQRYVDLGLQTHRVKCRVHNDFKLILIAEKTTVYEKFPTPLINRLEKHFVLTETVLLDWQREVLTELTNWVHQFSKVNQVDTKFTEQDAFVGYQNDTPASVIFQATQQLHQERPEQDEDSEEWKEAVLTRSKRILLQMASPDALIRLHHTTLADDQRRLSQIYFSEQHHGSIVQFLVHHLHNGSHISGQHGLLIQVTTHSHLLSSQELNELCQHIDMREDQVLCFLLQEFDTEMDFSNKISPAFSQHNKKDTLLIIQCDSGHLFGDLIACARYRIDDEREKANYQWKERQDFVHVLFIIHLPRQAGETDKHSSSFVGFQGGSWISAHIDDIRAPLKTALTLNDALSAPISDLFYNRDFLSYKEPVKVGKTESERGELEKENADMEIEGLETNEQSLHFNREHNMETEQDMETDETEALEQLNAQINFHEETSYGKMEVDEEFDGISMETYTSPVTEPFRVRHNQCYRLYNCIQAAVARMVENDDTRKEWAAHRVRLLLELIPQNPTYPLDDHTFYGALVKHIRNMLKERDTVYQDKEWVLKEALSGRKLQIGGTFQNVLERRLDEVIVPIFAAILSFTDHYSNLDLIKPSHPRQEQLSPLQQLWLQIFSDDKLCQFSYQSFSIGKGIEYHDFQSAVHKVGTPGVAVMEQLSCQFPFFWLVKEAIDSKLESAKHTAGGHRQRVHTQLCEILTDTPVASILNEVSEEHWIEFYQLYFHDYLRSVHFIAHHKSDEEYEIIGKALHAIITGPDFIGGLSSLVSLLAAVHIVYYQYQQEIMWFGQLTTHIPGILVQLDKTIEYSSQYMELPLYAVKVAINENNLALPLDPDDRAYIPHRLVKLQLCQNAIDSILTLAEPTAELTREIRHSWQSVRAVQFFVEHIVTKFSIDDKKFVELVRYAKRIQLFLKSQPDFTKAKTVQNVQKVLRALDGDTGKKKLKYSSDMQKTIREYCKSFFMEVVSSLCFGQPNPPEPALIKELLTVVFTEQDKTKDFSYSDKEKVDKVPVIRSFLLQLLLEHNTEIVREHLEDYFTRSQQIIKDDRSLCLLCIQCFEDALHKQYSYIHDKVRHAHQVMNEGIEVIMSSPAPSIEGGIHLQYLEGIAKLRYAIVVVAELLHCQHGTSSRHQSYYTHETQLLLDVTKRCCINDIINTDNSGPGVFLVKQLARQYGVSFLTNLTSDQTMQWIVPHHLQRSNEDQQTSDPFVIYQGYGNLRTALTDAVYGQKLDKLQKTTEGLNLKGAPALLLGIYQVITGSCVFTDESKKVTDEIRAEISSLTKRCKILNRSLMWTAQALIDNTYCGRLEPMLLRPGMSPQNRLLTDLIIHLVTALQSKEKLVILQPFIRMMNSPGELKGAYLPTMPEDSLPIARSAIGGAFYECPRGHPYFISECGRPMQRYNCPQCGSAIGGQNYQLTSGNRTARTTDTTETGYALGHPDQRETVPSSERTLSPAACAIVRVLMHTSLLWASCNNEHAIEGLIDLTKAQVRPADLPLFFWQHLQRDIDILSRAMGKSKDESCLILHMILKDIVTEESTGVTTYATLGAKNARTEWERCFNNVYIEPILNKLEVTLQQATHLLVNDKREDRDRLFYVIHERMSVAPKDILPHLWTYRSRITLEHLFQTLQTHKDTCPILHEFIQQEPLLRATQYLPGIIKLQQQMYELSHRRLDITDVAQYTIGEFIKELGKGNHTVQKRNQFREKLDCVRNAWSLVKDKLKEHSRVPVDSEYLTRVTWNESLPLSYLIPTLTGPGVCTVGLVDLLVGVHNDFIEKCRSQLKKKQKKDIMWREHKVPVSHIQHCHLLEYEHQLLSIVLSHCHYSLEHGKGQNVTYDLPALEKHVVDRFIHGKPLIQLEIPQVVYRKDVYTAETFANIRKNISPQIKLSARQQTEIVTELRTMQSLRECLDVVEIVIGFLSSGRTDANTELKKYVKKVLKMERKFTSKKAMEYCNLGHILSLWETISVQMAKTLTLSRQEPFDSLGQDFLQMLDKDVDKELRRFLRQADIPPLLNLLYEFIETNVRHRNLDENEWPLIDTLVAHLDNYGLEGLPPQFEEQFPQTITVGQAVATWKAIVFYQQQHENDIKD